LFALKKKKGGLTFRFLAPKMVIYDNACHLHTYCLNRDPVRYQATQFKIDRFHWKNHTACSSGYHLHSWHGMNSEVVEQKNSLLKNLRSQLSYMTVGNFMVHCALFLAHANEKQKKEKK